MYADDKPQGPEWKSAEEETNALRIDRLERKVNQASADISSLAPIVKANESAAYPHWTEEQVVALFKRLGALEQKVKSLEEKAPPVYFVEGAKDKIEARGDAMVDVMEGVLAAEERGERVDSALALLARRVASLEEAAVPLDTAVRLTNLESEMSHLRPHRNEDPRQISSTHPDAGDPDWLWTPSPTRQVRFVGGGRSIGKTEASADVLIERQPPFTLSYLQGHRRPIATTEDMAHARGLAHAYAPVVGVAIHCRDANGRMIFEVEPGEEEGS